MPIQTKSVFSSHVDSLSYDDQTRELSVTYQNGKTAIHSGVDPDVARAVMEAPSVGEALHQNIRGKFAHRYR